MTSPRLSRLLEEADIARDYSLALVAGLTPAQIAWRPHERSSAIGWHLGHQAAVTHYLVRNLASAEPSLNPEFDRLFDAATDEPHRGTLPPVPEIMDYRTEIAARSHAVIGRIADGDVGAPQQLAIIADGLLRATINHEYQHAAWIGEVRATLTDLPPPTAASNLLATIDGYAVLLPGAP
jgi:hypothetical protein